MKKLTMEDLFVNNTNDKEQIHQVIETGLEKSGIAIKDCYFAEVINQFGSMSKMKRVLNFLDIPYEGRTFTEVINDIADKLNSMSEPQRIGTIAVMAAIMVEDKHCGGTVGFSDVVA